MKQKAQFPSSITGFLIDVNELGQWIKICFRVFNGAFVP